MSHPDDEWEYETILSGDGSVIRYITNCLHGRLENVESVDGEVVARLCLTCDEQLPVGWS